MLQSGAATAAATMFVLHLFLQQNSNWLNHHLYPADVGIEAIPARKEQRKRNKDKENDLWHTQFIFQGSPITTTTKNRFETNRQKMK